MRRTPLLALAVLASSLLSVGALAQSAQTQPRITQKVDETKLVILKGGVHPLARAEYDRGLASSSLPMKRILMVLQRSPQQEAALKQLLEDQQSKSSPRFHQWLTPKQFGQQFGPADSDVAALTGWLESKGFAINKVYDGRTTIEFTGTAAQVQSAFHTEIHKYNVAGVDHIANASAPRIPAALAPVVLSIDSLNNFPRKSTAHFEGNFKKNSSTGKVTQIGKASGLHNPNFTTTAFGPTFYAVGPGDFATIYNVAGAWSSNVDGTGQTIAIVGRSDINPADFVNFRTLFGLPIGTTTGPTGTQYLNIITNGIDPGFVGGDEGESDLDVQWSGAVAKGATIDFVTSASTETTDGVDLSALYVIDNNLAPVMSESYGECEAFLQGGNFFYYYLWEQAAAQGITAFVSSGDNASASCDDPNANYPSLYGLQVSGIASTPYNVAVGGTDFDDFNNLSTYWNSANAAGPSGTLNTSAKSYIPETTWNDNCSQYGVDFCNGTGTNPTPPADYTDYINVVGGSGGVSGCTDANFNPNGSFTCAGYNPQPPWQIGAGLPAYNPNNPRSLPDVSLFASNGFNYSLYVFCEQDASASGTCDINDFGGAGGTSFASPAFAGIMGLVDQKTASRQGNANFVFYQLAAQAGASCNSNGTSLPAASCTFNDVQKGTNSVPCLAGVTNCSDTNPADATVGLLVLDTTQPPTGTNLAYTAGAGYDAATGLGSVNVANLVTNWASITCAYTGTATALTLNGATTAVTVTHGTYVTAGVTVTAAAGTPTGDFSLLASPGATLTGVDVYTLSGGTASVGEPALPGGSYNLTAQYAGDGKFAPSTSNAIAVTVNPEASTTTVATLVPSPSGFIPGATAIYGQSLVRVDVNGVSAPGCSTNGGTPAEYCTPATGSVSLKNGSTAFTPATIPLNSSSYSEIQFTVPAGTYSLTATYPGDASFSASTSAATAFTITQDPTTASLTANPNGNPTPITAGTNSTLTVVIDTTSFGAAPTGTVTFTNGTVTLGTATLAPNGSDASGYITAAASLQTNGFTIGSNNITATYGGDNNYSGSTVTATGIVVVSGATFNIAVNPSSLTIKHNTTGTTTVTLSPVDAAIALQGITLSCVNPPAGVTCAFSPSPTQVTSVGANATSTLTITLAKPLSGSREIAGRAKGWLEAGGVTSLACLLLIGLPGRRRRLRIHLLLVMLTVSVLSLAIGCGGSFKPVMDSVTISATDGTTTQTTTLQLNID